MRNYSSVGIQVADILLPKNGLEAHKWATIACDQFTSQPEYWQKVADIIGAAPSTYNLVLPEVFLGTPNENERIQLSQQKMREYVHQELLDTHTGLIYVERTSLGRLRRGLMLALDLENYDFNKGSQTLIRATEDTILNRLPPRMRIREGAILELPHILVLIDDPDCSVIDPISAEAASLPLLYDFDLMQGSGHLTGRLVNTPALEKQVIAALERLASPEVFYSKYDVTPEHGVLLFAVGDGNHSLATAKAIWEKIKPVVGMNHPARYALVEIENVHDEGLHFEPIHRVVFGCQSNPRDAMKTCFGDALRFSPCQSPEEVVEKVETYRGNDHVIGLVNAAGPELAFISHPSANLPVGTLQSFLDTWIGLGNAENLDYVHGADVVLTLGKQPGNCGFYLPAMPKNGLFKTVILDGALPRKTFSMGEAVEKRFYMEARRIG
ncbi:MAG TPA: DUF1015 domain-containing protein [Anaerolineaceae bacterium]|nr:MAG: hypothetical protein A2X24_10160 [Chloroflexi bacterium GWB2_54_36]HAL15264.1 DUF1015 domain-containing protein [Anaerolineaceae bacterium]HBA91181.1 DUF1015 domain-containing protein [Anaerolineaceae bacterium]